jgi:hypothetical protein
MQISEISMQGLVEQQRAALRVVGGGATNCEMWCCKRPLASQRGMSALICRRASQEPGISLFIQFFPGQLRVHVGGMVLYLIPTATHNLRLSTMHYILARYVRW